MALTASPDGHGDEGGAIVSGVHAVVKFAAVHFVAAAIGREIAAADDRCLVVVSVCLRVGQAEIQVVGLEILFAAVGIGRLPVQLRGVGRPGEDQHIECALHNGLAGIVFTGGNFAHDLQIAQLLICGSPHGDNAVFHGVELAFVYSVRLGHFQATCSAAQHDQLVAELQRRVRLRYVGLLRNGL